jgi:hypothetical protein
MGYYTQPTNEVRIRWYVDGDYAPLKLFLESSEDVKSVSVSSYTTDSIPDPTAVVNAIGRNSLVVHLKPEFLALANVAAVTVVQKLVSKWIDERNASRKKDIDDGKDGPLLFDQHGHTIKISKRRR